MHCIRLPKAQLCALAMKQRYYSNMSDETLQPPTVDGPPADRPASQYRPPLPPRTPLSPPDEAEEHPDLQRPENVKRTSYFPMLPEPEDQSHAQTPASTKLGPDFVDARPANIDPPCPPSDSDATRESPKGLNDVPVNTNHPLPPQRQSGVVGDVPNTSSSPTWHRSATTLTAFLIPFPKPQLPPVSAQTTSDLIPPRFMIYTPPSAPFLPKSSGETRIEAWRKEGISHLCRRKWYEELREAKMRQPKNGKTTKWKRAKWRATKGTEWGIDKTKSTNLEFLNRVARLQDESDEVASDVYAKRMAPEELVLLHPPEEGLRMMSDGSHDDHDEELLREEFLASLGRTRKRAWRDSVISALLFAPAIVVDTFAVPVWPFGGLAEIDAVWFYASFRGARTSSSITKRLSTTSKSKQLDLTLAPFAKMDVLERYLAARCHDADPKLFPEYVATPSDTEVLKAIGWKHCLPEGEMGWEDRQWELTQVKDDLERCFMKAAKEWVKFCKRWVKDPEKAVSK